jgi:FRG domain
MKMESLKSVEDALSWIAMLPHGTPTAIFRGQLQQWPLLPTLFRYNPIAVNRWGGFKKLEARTLDRFKSRAYPFLSVVPQTEFDWMVLTQHHGCLTRLLDWTGNPLVGLIFASEKDDLPMTPKTRCFTHSQKKHSFIPQNTLLRGSPRKPPVSQFTLSW